MFSFLFSEIRRCIAFRFQESSSEYKSIHKIHCYNLNLYVWIAQAKNNSLNNNFTSKWKYKYIFSWRFRHIFQYVSALPKIHLPRQIKNERWKQRISNIQLILFLFWRLWEYLCANAGLLAVWRINVSPPRHNEMPFFFMYFNGA